MAIAPLRKDADDSDGANESWTPDWVQDAVFYQVFPERFSNGNARNDPPGTESWGGRPTRTSFFGGDLEGVIQKLDYLEDLGVTALYLTPVFTAPSNHKYDTEDYLAVDPGFGGTASLKTLVEALHRRGMRILLDGVFNHVGSQFWAFRDVVANGAGSRYRDWFIIDSFPIRQTPRPNYRACGGAPFLPKLNMDNPEVRQYLFSVAEHWVKIAGIDGWRLDVPWEVPHEFWREFRSRMKGLRPDLYLVGEFWGDAAPWLEGDQFDGAMNYPLRELALRFFTQRAIDAGTFARELARLRAAYPRQANSAMLNLLGCHDTQRLLTACRGREDVAIQALAFIFTYPGAPHVYYGDENGMTGGNDPGCRAPMVWEETRWRRSIRQAVTTLARLRREHVALRRGGFRIVLATERVIAFHRDASEFAGPGNVALVVANAGFQRESVRIPLRDAGQAFGHCRDHFGGREVNVLNGELQLTLEAQETAILLPD